MSRTIPIRRKLFSFAAVIGVVIVLVVGCTTAAQYWFTSKRALERELFTVADIIGSNVVAALTFRDHQAAQATLHSLERLPSVHTAVIYSHEGKVLASYTRAGASLAVPLEIPRHRRSTSSARSAEVFTPIEFEGETIGYLYLQSGTEAMFQELRTQLLLMALLLALALLTAGVIAVPLQRAIAEPILRLRAVAERITREENYQIRASSEPLDEIAALATSFNELIERVEKREASLRQSQGDLRELNEALRRSNAELSEFAHIASHDLQEPLRKIQTFGDRLKVKCGPELSPDAMRYLERTDAAAGRMRNLIDDLLALSRVMAKGKEFGAVELRPLLLEVLDALSERIREESADVQCRELPTVYGDRSQLFRLFQNLIGNALKYHRPDIAPKIVIYAEQDAASPTSEFTTILIEDNGIGFDQQYAEQIFKPFHRLHSREAYPGTGIGLAICQKIVERHGGTIAARGVEDRGACFLLRLPVTGHHMQTRSEAA
ncbi:MAG: HAMP domain-containing protein [Bdellovibrionales bacterium]|nr:HAMP domain-containing protein [Bdellovibrionales bacterium]